MNVEEYFPEGLSVIHPDESQREGRKKEEYRGLSPALHCHICYKTLTGLINNVDFIKPCNCQLMFVHRECAKRNRAKFGEAKCSNCGHGSTIPRAGKVSHIGPMTSTSDHFPIKEAECFICHNQDYKSDDKKAHSRKIRPCFCSRAYHYGCFSETLSEGHSCVECNVHYRSFKNATVGEFLAKKWFFYFIYIIILAILCTMLVLSFKNSIVFTKSNSEANIIDRELLLTFTSIFFLVVITASIFCVTKYTLNSAIPTFRISHGKALLKPFKNSGSYKLPKKELETVKEDEFEEIPLTEVKKLSVDESQVPELEVLEDARGYETEDMTLGQHMFGVYATHHSSSTPIDKPPLGFVFSPVETDLQNGPLSNDLLNS